jgi:hypothetical protein
MHAIIAKDLSRIVRDADRELAIVDGLSFSVCWLALTYRARVPWKYLVKI